ncbi:Uncharacterised protein [Pantoea agglomerans]|uniref:Uncharacterized protein n=1 Tax=Enterobacter agglomerans TaxID=549 RepID=A0A379APE1_ENTAG|nr:Uncharacterised protein [Pantoea agglomerans]
MKNNYDDLQRFKEKTQTLDIDFKDMSGQTQEAAEHSKWALIRQLAKEEHQTPFGGGERIDLPQPQPLRGDEFTAPPPGGSGTTCRTYCATGNGSPHLDSR